MESAGLPSTEFRPIRRTSTRRGEADEVGLDERARRVRIQAESVSEPPLGQLVRPQAQSSPCCEGASSPSRRPSLLVGGLRIVEEKSTLFLSRPCMTRQRQARSPSWPTLLERPSQGPQGAQHPAGQRRCAPMPARRAVRDGLRGVLCTPRGSGAARRCQPVALCATGSGRTACGRAPSLRSPPTIHGQPAPGAPARAAARHLQPAARPDLMLKHSRGGGGRWGRPQAACRGRRGQSWGTQCVGVGRVSRILNGSPGLVRSTGPGDSGLAESDGWSVNDGAPAARSGEDPDTKGGPSPGKAGRRGRERGARPRSWCRPPAWSRPAPALPTTAPRSHLRGSAKTAGAPPDRWRPRPRRRPGSPPPRRRASRWPP